MTSNTTNDKDLENINCYNDNFMDFSPILSLKYTMNLYIFFFILHVKKFDNSFFFFFCFLTKTEYWRNKTFENKDVNPYNF